MKDLIKKLFKKKNPDKEIETEPVDSTEIESNSEVVEPVSVEQEEKGSDYYQVKMDCRTYYPYERWYFSRIDSR